MIPDCTVVVGLLPCCYNIGVVVVDLGLIKKGAYILGLGLGVFPTSVFRVGISF